ncbi:MAG TPA: response regulator [Azospira sp.]|nr:response regulator [Azospira sp.]
MHLISSVADLSVVLVEPSSTQAHIVEQFLRDLGITQLQRAGNGAEALSILRQAKPAVVISAMYLPDMTGTELVYAMRDDADLEMVPFVLISTETRPQVLEPIRQSGACSIVPKPFTEKQLLTALRAVVDYLEPEGQLETPVDLESLKVLIVDDSPTSRKFLRHVLENLGIENFLEATNGKEAVTVLGETMVDLVLTDYNMPEMDGKALVEYIRNQSWQATVPVLMVTSESNMSRLAAVEQAGVSAICDKPFDPKTVKGLIERALWG